MPIIKANGYRVNIGTGSFKAISTFLTQHHYASYFILCDENTLQNCLPLLIAYCPELGSANIIEIESGEASKSLEFCAQIWQTLIENQAAKDSLIINLGGGVVSDLGGFTASVYKRGVDFINVPTSLLAMADASIGGKTGIDFNNLKNSVGTFAQPKAVFVNPVFLETLAREHYQNGLAEIFKIALVYDKDLWHSLKDLIGIKNDLRLISRSITLKNEIVLKDPFDKGLRKILNFGHTIGHALEALFLNSGSELLHGEAVVIGMIIESEIAFQKKILPKKEYADITIGLLSTFELKKIDHIPVDAIIELIKNDKKNSDNKLYFSLITKIGTCKYDLAVTENQIIKSIAHYNTLYK